MIVEIAYDHHGLSESALIVAAYNLETARRCKQLLMSIDNTRKLTFRLVVIVVLTTHEVIDSEQKRISPRDNAIEFSWHAIARLCANRT